MQLSITTGRECTLGPQCGSTLRDAYRDTGLKAPTIQWSRLRAISPEASTREPTRLLQKEKLKLMLMPQQRLQLMQLPKPLLMLLLLMSRPGLLRKVSQFNSKLCWIRWRKMWQTRRISMWTTQNKRRWMPSGQRTQSNLGGPTPLNQEMWSRRWKPTVSRKK